MGDLKFMPQSMLDIWTDLGKIELDGTTLRIPSESVSFTLTPAVRFLSIIEGEDVNKLLAKVKPDTFVREIGGEVMTDSCLIGETAYQVQPGFLAEAEALAAAQTAKATRKLAPKADAAKPTPAPVKHPSNPPPPPSPAPAKKRLDDGDGGLPAFLLESLD